MKTIILLLMLGWSVCFAFPTTPNVAMTTGVLCTTTDKDFSEYRYPENIPYCKRNVNYNLKTNIYESYQIPLSERKEYTIDHVIPLSIGGSNDRKNLWPEHISLRDSRIERSSGVKLEQYVYEQVRAGKMSQAEAIKIIKKSKYNLTDN